MKSSITLLLAILAGYFAYTKWFSSKREETAHREAPAAPKERGPEAAPAETLDIRTEPPPAVAEAGAAGELERAWREAAASGDAARAREAEERILAEQPRSAAARKICLDRGEAGLQEYERLKKSPEGYGAAQEARLWMTRALFAGDPSPSEQARLRDQLGRLAKELFFAPRHVEGVDLRYTPKSGDNLEMLCRKVLPAQGAKTSPGMIAEVNGMKSPRDLRAGEAIKVPLGELRIVVVKREFRVYALFQERYVCDFPCGLGKDDLTPEGEFEIDSMLVNPDWNPKPGVTYPYGDPRNTIGTRWMGFKATEHLQGFGLHGTSDEGSIGRAESAGCVRLSRADVERLYAWTPRGTRVTILP